MCEFIYQADFFSKSSARSLAKHLIELSIVVFLLEVRVAADKNTINEDIGHGALASFGFEGSLNFSTVWNQVKLNQEELSIFTVEKVFCLSAEWAVRLRVDDDFVASDV